MRSKRAFILRMVILLSILCQQKLLFCQIYFSQFYSSPLSVNPANTGLFEGDYRVGGVYRNESAQLAPNSKASFFLDTRILGSVLPENDKLAIGVAAIGEKNPYFGLTNTFLLGSLAYHKSLNADGTQQLGFGFQADLSHQHLQTHNLVFENDLRNSGFADILPGQNNLNFSYADISVGVNYQGLLTEEDKVTIGLSVYHANHPYKLVNNNVFSLAPQACMQGGWQHKIDDRRLLQYDLLISASTDTHTINDLFGSVLYQTKINESEYRMGAGAAFRRNYLSGTTLSPCISLLYDSFSLNLLYSIPVSGKTTDLRSAVEVGLVYTGRKHSGK